MGGVTLASMSFDPKVESTQVCSETGFTTKYVPDDIPGAMLLLTEFVLRLDCKGISVDEILRSGI